MHPKISIIRRAMTYNIQIKSKLNRMQQLDISIFFYVLTPLATMHKNSFLFSYERTKSYKLPKISIIPRIVTYNIHIKYGLNRMNSLDTITHSKI